MSDSPSPLQQADPEPAEDERADRWFMAIADADRLESVQSLIALADAEQSELRAERDRARSVAAHLEDENALLVQSVRLLHEEVDEMLADTTDEDNARDWQAKAVAAEGRLAAIQAAFESAHRSILWLHVWRHPDGAALIDASDVIAALSKVRAVLDASASSGEVGSDG